MCVGIGILGDALSTDEHDNCCFATTIAFHHGCGRSMPHLGKGAPRGSAGLKVTVGSVSMTKKALVNNRLSSDNADSDCSTVNPEDTSSERSADSEIDMSPQRTEPTGANKSEVPASPTLSNDTAVLIFDWDDTLLPTTFCEGLPPIPNSAAVRSSHLPFFVALRKHAQNVETVLRAARAVACVSIVTLSKRPWVMQSAERWLLGLDFPALVHELGISIYYANEHTGRPDVPPSCLAQDYTAWKRNAMAKCLTDWYATGVLGKARLNVTSIGDGLFEQQALKDLLKAWGQTGLLAQAPLCKTLKLMDHPTLSQLSDELLRLTPGLQCMAHQEKPFDLCIDDPAKLTTRTLFSSTGASQKQ